MYGLSQTSGTGGRIESFLGNAAYMAIYMYFHIFLAFWLFVESRSTLLRTIYALLAVLFIYTLIETGTRGTSIGLLVGGFVMVAYMALFGSKYPEFRKYAIGVFAILVLATGGFFVARDSNFVQESQSLSRIANIDLASDLQVRGTIWNMAWEGVKERPILGWGQGNFNYVFNEKYDPFMYNQEQWFDRTHNIVFDWLIAGGFLGLIAYMGIFGACIYYLVVLPVRKPEDQTFTVLERSVLLGILAGYMTHNLVVFDNIISYIFFAVILALIHSRVGEPMPFFTKLSVDKQLFNQFLVPVAGVIVVALIYTLHLPGMHAASDIISAYRQEKPADRLAAFERALVRDSFARQEIVEQISQQAMGIFRDENASAEVKKQFITLAETELQRLAQDKPGDARVHVFFSSFYRGVNNLAGAEEQIKIAHELSPRKPSILMQYAIIKYSQGDLESARNLFKQAYELDRRNDEALTYYAALLFATGASDEAKELANDERLLKLMAMNDFVLSEVSKAEETEFLRTLYASRVEQQPATAQNWASLSFLLYQDGQKEEAIEVLEKASEAVPTFKKAAQCFIANIKAGNEPQEGCTS
jgi:O-antigen ligase/Flp pilus assembly protein TadD